MSLFTDEKFIRYVVEQYSGMITRIAFQHVKNRQDAEDIMQEVFIALLKRQTFDTDEHLKAWLIRVTVNKSKDYLRAAKRRNTIALNRDYALTQEQIGMFDELEKLPKKDCDILYLFYYEGYQASEIAKILGKKESAVFVRLNRAREKLKAFLKEEN